MNSQTPLRIYFLASEADPFVKVGGLGDVAGSLPPALRSLSASLMESSEVPDQEAAGPLDVRLVLPFHGSIKRTAFEFRPVASFNIASEDGPIPAEVFDTEIDGLPIYLISGAPITADAPVYSGNNRLDGYKYTFFSMAALELARRLGWQPDIVHANDWHTAPAVYWLGIHRGRDPFYSKTATLLGVHNLPYLGNGAGPALAAFGLPPAANSLLPWWAQDMPLPLGLLEADKIVAVSPTYAQEILTPEFGSGLQDFLQTRAADITGILNGIDESRWNPVTDAALPVRYSFEDLTLRLENKTALQAEFNFPQEPRLPLLAMINRMDPQKGVDLAIDALRSLAEGPDAVPWQAIILGSGVKELEDAAKKLQADFPDRVRSIIRFDPALSRRIYGGADALLIPSRYEPCGLTQMISMRYGCVPVARATGGLRDTVLDYSEEGPSNGFLFTDATPQALAWAIQRAISVYADLRRWRALQRRGMREDFSWENSARQYLELYQTMIGHR